MANSENPERFGSRYVLGERLGRGAMGVVHLGTASHLASPVAVKLLRPDLADDPEVVTRFVRERNLFRAVDHRNVVRVHEFVVDGDRLGIVMEYVEGGDLRQRQATAPLSPADAVAVMAQVAAGLGAVHEAGIVHRDLKPANVLLDTTLGALTPKISDFGVSRLVGSTGTRSSMVVGTPLYMAPESVEVGQGGSAVDLYAVGIMLFELLTGRPPFESDSVLSLVRMHALEPPPRLVGGPSDLGDLVDRLLAKEPADRPTAPETVDALTRLAPNLSAVAGPLSARPAETPTATPDDVGTIATSLAQTITVAPPPGTVPPSGSPAASGPPAAWPVEPASRLGSRQPLANGGRWTLSVKIAAAVGGLAVAALAAFVLLRPGAGEPGLASGAGSEAISTDLDPASNESNAEAQASGTARLDRTSTSAADLEAPAGPTVDGGGTDGDRDSPTETKPSSGSGPSTSDAPTGSATTPTSSTVATTGSAPATSASTTSRPVVDPSIRVSLSTFPCDGNYHTIGTISGMTPNGQVRYTSPTPDPPTYTDTADTNGQLQPTWRCTDTTARTITRTATDLTTGKNITYSYTTQPV